MSEFNPNFCASPSVKEDRTPDEKCGGCGNVIGNRCRYWQTPRTKSIWPCSLRTEIYLREAL